MLLNPFDLREVRVTVDHGVALVEACSKSRLSSVAPAAVVHHPDTDFFDLDDPAKRKRGFERRLVHVPADGLDRGSDRFQPVEERRGNEIAGVQDQVCRREAAQTLVGQRALSAREMRVGDDGDAGQDVATGSATTAPGSSRNRPAFHTSSPSA